MEVNNDFAAYDAALEGPLCTLGGVAMVVAVLFAIAAAWLGVAGNRYGTRKSHLGPVIGFVILGIFGLWVCQALTWAF